MTDLTSAFATFRLLDGPWQQAAEVHEAGDPLAEANALWAAAAARPMTGAYPAAAVLHGRPLELYRSVGSRQGEANALHGLGRPRLMTGNLAGAVELGDAGLALSRSLGDPRGPADDLWYLGLAD